MAGLKNIYDFFKLENYFKFLSALKLLNSLLGVKFPK